MKATMSGTSGDNNNYTPPPDGSTVQISRAVPSQQAVDTYDIVGTGDHGLGSNCSSLDSSGQPAAVDNPTSATTCKCTYSYTRIDGNRDTVESDTTYHESDLIRCPVPAAALDLAVSYLYVKIHLTQSDSFTNELKIPVTGAGSGSTDTKDIESYTLAHRYQCRDIVSISFTLHGGTNGIYDPIQSEDPRITYPINFYTNNMGKTFSLFGLLDMATAAFWNCPMLPNDSTAGLDLAVYSKGPDNGGSKRIYPPAGSAFDRSTFFLAKKAIGGIFNVPVNAYILPTVRTSNKIGNTDIPPLGYGATPIPTGNNTETCPDLSYLPPKYHWVKVWNFRATLPQRVFRTSRKIGYVNSMACNPGNWSDGTPIVKDCANLQTMNKTVSDRWLYGNMCVRFSGFNDLGAYVNSIEPCGSDRQGHGPGCSTKADGISIYDVFKNPIDYNLPAGTDVWAQSGNSTTGSCSDDKKWDPLGLCGTTPGNVPYEGDTPEWSAVTNGDGTNTARADFLLIATPISVMAATMRDSSRTENYPYIPFRFKSATSCNSPDPDNPIVAGDCPGSDRIDYAFISTDVNTPADPQPGDTVNSRSGSFPVCAIQPD